MYCQPNRLPDRRRSSICQRHKPGFGRLGRERRYGGYAASEREAFEGLVERDGDEEDDEGWARGDGDGDADEDAVEKDAGFEEEAL